MNSLDFLANVSYSRSTSVGIDDSFCLLYICSENLLLRSLKNN